MKILTIEILEDCTDTGGFGVEGYEIKLTTNLASINAFVNMRNVVTTQTAVYLHGLFEDSPFTASYVDQVNIAVQTAFKKWNPKIRTVQVDI